MFAEIYSNVDRLSDSVPLLERARAIYCSGTNNEISCVRTLNSLGATFLLLDRPQLDELPLLEALSIVEGTSDRSALTPTLGLLARVYTVLGDDTRGLFFKRGWMPAPLATGVDPFWWTLSERRIGCPQV
jgi:hypothetical protein